MEKILELLLELMRHQTLDIQQEKKIRNMLNKYRYKQQKITSAIDAILRDL
jgi:hypothetical protein